jgi:hypothetical protein
VSHSLVRHTDTLHRASCAGVHSIPGSVRVLCMLCSSSSSLHGFCSTRVLRVSSGYGIVNLSIRQSSISRFLDKISDWPKCPGKSLGEA